MLQFKNFLRLILFPGLSLCLIFFNFSGLNGQESTFRSTAAELRDINIKMLADEEFSSIPHGKELVEEALYEVSSEFEELFGLRFHISGWSHWHSDNNLKSVAALAESLDFSFENREADLLMAITSQKNMDREYSGISVFRAGVVVIIFNPQREKLRRLLAHELGHVFGAVHVPLSDSIMNCYGEGEQFDSYSLAIIKLGRNRSFKPYKFPFPAEIRPELENYYLKIRERIRRLEGIDRLFNEPARAVSAGPSLSNLTTARCLSDCFLMLAQIELEKKDYQQAIKYCEEGLKLNPDDFEGLNLEAIALRRSGEIEKSVAIYHSLLKNDFQRPTKLFNLGIAYSKLNQLKEAENAYREALRWKPKFIEAHNNLGEIFLRQGRLEEAEKELRLATELGPDFALAFSNLGDLYLRLKQTVKARQSIERALELDPDLASAHNLMGNYWRQEGKLNEARDEYQKALKLDPDYEKAWYNLGVIASDFGRWEEAKEFFLKSIELQPNFAEGYAGLGLYYLQMKKWDEAISHLRKAQELGYKNPTIWVNLSYAYMNRKEWKKAEEAARRAVNEEPGLALAYNNLGIALAQQNKLEEARQVLEQSLRIDSQDRDALMNLATVELSLNNEQRALELFLKIISLAPKDSRNGIIFNNIAVIYYHQGRYDLSFEFAQKALKAGFKVEESFLAELEKRIKKEGH